MEAPEKIYIIPRQGGDYSPYWRNDSQDEFGIEYTRTDAFIEKACSWLKNHYRDYMYNPTGEKLEAFFGGDMYNDFKKYMKGE